MSLWRLVEAHIAFIDTLDGRTSSRRLSSHAAAFVAGAATATAVFAAVRWRRRRRRKTWRAQSYTGGGGRTARGRKRVAFTMRFDAAKLAEYKRRHELVWLDMQEALVRCGWREYSLYCRADGLAVGVFEAEGSLAECAARMDAEPINAEWQKSMQKFTAAGGRPDEAFCELEHYFYLGEDREA